jgi:hypothetical protein
MQKTKNGGLKSSSHGWDWREVVLWLGGLGWWTSILLQLAWNTIGLCVESRSTGLASNSGSSSIFYCVEKSFEKSSLDDTCSTMLSSWTGHALLVGLLTMWWNGRLRDRVRGSGGKLVGLSDYYKLQAIILSARASAWWILTTRTTRLSPSATRMVHGFFLAFGILVRSRRLFTGPQLIVDTDYLCFHSYGKARFHTAILISRILPRSLELFKG